MRYSSVDYIKTADSMMYEKNQDLLSENKLQSLPSILLKNQKFMNTLN